MNTPWSEYVDVALAPKVERQMLELPSDGPPGFLRAALFSAVASRLAGVDGAGGKMRGTVVCCPGCYECMEGPSCLYNNLASLLPQTGVAVLQLAFRPPGDNEEEAAEDVMTCVDWLSKRKSNPLILIGWSFGAAAVIEGAFLRRNAGAVAAIITLAGQTAGTRNVKHLEVPLLALHGEGDRVLPINCSRAIAQRSQCGTLNILPQTTHRMEHALPHVMEFVNAHLPEKPRCESRCR